MSCSPCEEIAKESVLSLPYIHSFLTQVLHAIQLIQNQSECSNGVTITEISKFMKENYGLDGDVYSQVETSVLQGVKNGFLLEEDNKYSLIGAMAKVQLCNNFNRRRELVEDLRDIFIYHSNSEKSRRDIDSIIETKSEYILEVLQKLQDIIDANEKVKKNPIKKSKYKNQKLKAKRKPSKNTLSCRYCLGRRNAKSDMTVNCSTASSSSEDKEKCLSRKSSSPCLRNEKM